MTSVCFVLINVETIDHLFFTCFIDRYIRGVVRCSFNFNYVPVSFDALTAWLESFDLNDRLMLSSGIAALIWALEIQE